MPFPHRNARQGFKTRRLDRLRQTSGRFTGFRRDRQCLQGPRERVGIRVHAGGACKTLRLHDRRRQCLTVGFGGATQIGGTAAERGDLYRSKRCAALDRSIVDRPRVPVHLVDRPGHSRRLLQCLDALRLVSAERLCHCLGKRRPRGHELR